MADGERNRVVHRSELKDWCRMLGHDPAKVKRIIVEADKVTVEYEHLVMPDPEDRD